MTFPCVDILLSTYNGAAYLEEQINSIISQTQDNWRLIIRDDGSSDGTLEILDRVVKKDSRIIISESSGNNLGVVGSFMSLLHESTSPYFSFCDQDDYWLPEKLAITSGILQREPDASPALVYSDLIVADVDLAQKYPSFMSYQNFSPLSAANWPRNVLQNTVVGCACMGNRALRDLVLSSPPSDWSDVIMHDWWLAMVASRFGRIIFEPRKTVLYRQHSSNQLGAKGVSLWRYVRALRDESPVSKVKLYLERVAVQVEAFRCAYQEMLTVEDNELLGMVSRIRVLHGPERAILLFRCYRNDVRMQSIGRDLAVLITSPFG